MKKMTLASVAFCLLLAACQPKKENVVKEETKTQTAQNETDSTAEKWNGYTKISPEKIPDNAIQLFNKQWMLITAGNKESYNTMTASWGTLGELWQKPVGICFVRDSRYTHQFMEKEQYYTLSFFGEQYREALRICGTLSGRDGDKVKKAGLTPLETPTKSMSFSEARMIIECRKIYAQPFDKKSFVDKNLYQEVYGKGDGIHTMYIGDIVSVWVK